MAEGEVINQPCKIKRLERQTSLSARIESKGISGALANRHTVSPTGYVLYDRINDASSPDQLENLARTIWDQWGKGELGDEEADFLTGAIDDRRPLRRPPAAPGALARLNSRLCSRFTSRQRPRSPDRKASRDRRRTLGGSSALPDTLRHHYTEGQRAVLCIVAGEVKRHGVCDLPIDKIAALAGVCRTTVQNTMHEARRLAHLEITERPIPGRKHLPNLVQIISPEWRAWIRRGPLAHRAEKNQFLLGTAFHLPIGSKGVNLVSTTKIKGLKQATPVQAARPQGALEKMQWPPAHSGLRA